MSEKVRGTINIVEIIAVILVVGVFITLVIPKLGFQRRMENKCHQNIMIIAQAESLYFAKESVYTDDFDDLKDYVSEISKINFCPLDSATYVIKLKRDTLTVDPSTPDSALLELDFIDTTRTKYIEINPKEYTIQCLYGHGKVANGKPNWAESK
ncbi:MAG: hypothetical protein KBA26_00630 [Candidatus Delongbacteria bacterium]|nr:hypothetical protein [Candidatus Delongbacteria bacterium]